MSVCPIEFVTNVFDCQHGDPNIVPTDPLWQHERSRDAIFEIVEDRSIVSHLFHLMFQSTECFSDIVQLFGIGLMTTR